MSTHHPRSRFLFAFFLLMFASASQGFARTYTIQFGGALGFTYSPNSLNVLIGDTIKWIGDFSTYPLQSSSVPAGASSIGPVSLGDTFSYIVKIAGEYDFQNNMHASLGMTGSFIAVNPLYGLTNEGREFYLGMFFPSYISVQTFFTQPDLRIYSLVSSYYDNDVSFSYFDSAGKEFTDKIYHIAAGNSLKIPLLISAMQMDSASDATAFKSCHIKSKYPITVLYISVGACAGGSYLALPVLGLGKNYVAASYNDDPGIGAAIYSPGQSPYLPLTFEYAGGEFMVIGTEYQTYVRITPTTTTVTGHPGANTGAPHPFTIQLNKGQCYLVRSNGRNEDNDLSGSLIEASHPVVVISGHENASLGSSDPYATDARDLMIEEMIPVEYWDSSGYVSVPLAEPSPYGAAGHGDTYRIYSYDSSNVKAHLDVQGISGGYDFTSTRLATPPQKADVSSPAEAYSLDGKKINLMQYDERSVTLNSPWPAPSMMSVIPLSRWKKSCFFVVPPIGTNSTYNYTEEVFINILSSNFANITVSDNRTSTEPISTLNKFGGYINISNNFPGLKANIYKFNLNFISHSFYISSTEPFMAYYYGNHDFGGSYLGDIQNHSALNYISEYAAPAGMQLNTGVTPSFIVDTVTTCSGWHVCLRDTGNNDPGLKAVILIDDPDGIYWQTPGAKASNVTFDSLSSDYADGELHPHFHSSQSYCFDVSFSNPLIAASAPLAIVDNLGNAIILQLSRTASALKLTTNPPSPKPDSIVFPVEKIGQQICTTFVFKNTVAVGGSPLQLNSLQLTNSDTTYKIQSVTPSLPHLLAAQDSITLQVCYTPMDSSRHQDSLVLHTDCFTLAISLDAHGATGLISAADLDFGSITAGTSLCKNLVIKNVGSAPFTLTRSFIVSDTVNFSCDSSKLPVIIKPDGSIQLQVCFHPKTEGSYSGGIDWTTDLEPSFAHSIKSHSLLTGQAIPAAGVKSQSASNSFSIRPNPASGNSVIVSFDAMSEAASLNVFDILGREVFQRNILSGMSRIEIPIQNFPVGTYYARLVTNTGIISQSFMKVK